MSLALIVLARQPSPGRCKRRLAASIGDESAARVQQRLLAHTVAVARQWQQSEAGAVVSLCLGHQQGPGGLGLRMQRQLGRAVRAGAKAAVLVGSDLPGLGCNTSSRRSARCITPQWCWARPVMAATGWWV